MDGLVVLTFIMGVVSSILGGLGGGGGGAITVPYLIFIGLPPANAIATAKLGGIGAAAGAATAFKGKGLLQKHLLIPFMAIALVSSFVAAWLLPRIDPNLFEKIIGVTLLAMVPVMFLKKAALQPGERTKGWITVGFMLYIVFSFMQTLVGSGVGSLLVVVLMLLFGLTALQANATKRVAQAVQAVAMFVLMALQGFVVWTHGIAGLLGSTIGAYIGGRIAVKKGSQFVKMIMAVIMAVSGTLLLVQ